MTTPEDTLQLDLFGVVSSTQTRPGLKTQVTEGTTIDRILIPAIALTRLKMLINQGGNNPRTFDIEGFGTVTVILAKDGAMQFQVTLASDVLAFKLDPSGDLQSNHGKRPSRGEWDKYCITREWANQVVQACQRKAEQENRRLETNRQS